MSNLRASLSVASRPPEIHAESLLNLAQILGTRVQPGLLNIGRTTFYTLIAEGILPKPIKLKRRSLWRYADILQAMQRLAASTENQTGPNP